MDLFNTSASYEQRLYLPIFEQKQVEVWMKRDDLLHPFVSGNKYRKLKYLIQDMLSQKKKHLVTFGGAYSNHLVATASAGAAAGLNTTAIVRGDEELDSPMLALCRLYGMEILQVSREEYRDKDSAFNRFFKEANSVYRIEEGGYSELGTKGCTDLLSELKTTYNHIFCAVGTGTTVAGLANGAGNDTKVHGVMVLKGAEYLQDKIDKLLIPGKKVQLHHEFHFGGYGKFDKEIIKFIRNFAGQTGVLLDPVYTAKMMLGINHLAENNYFKPRDKVLAVHTGGLWGLTSDKAVKLSGVL
ncbi:MAG TPA: pyridoxal-phosphate dependent enzyme [Bacteroidia bacterium]|nr:pyridoxal-phosphate dependent enzyme [Bacteroidia bacterium]